MAQYIDGFINDLELCLEDMFEVTGLYKKTVDVFVDTETMQMCIGTNTICLNKGVLELLNKYECEEIYICAGGEYDIEIYFTIPIPNNQTDNIQ